MNFLIKKSKLNNAGPAFKRRAAYDLMEAAGLSTQKAQHFTARLFDKYDLIYVMDRSNYRDVLELAGNETDRQKVQLFLQEAEVPDPYWDDNQFDPVFRLIEERCKAIIKEMVS